MYDIARDGTLVKVVGNIRDYEGKSHLLVFDVSSVTDWNELSYHLLDVMLTHCQQLEGSIPVSLHNTFNILLVFNNPIDCYTLIFVIQQSSEPPTSRSPAGAVPHQGISLFLLLH